jgi:acetyl-CoA carboxylase, biotin carboxylase subunit
VAAAHRHGRAPAVPAIVEPQGWAIECRITSEDPANGFLPSTGRVEYLRVPAGPGVRWDGGISAGTEVGLHYDPMLAKLIVHADTRALAIARMQRALQDLTIVGLDTSREFHLRVMDDAEYRAGAVDIQWLERRLPSLTGATPPPDVIATAALAAALLAEHDRAHPALASGQGGGAAPVAPESTWQQQARREALRPG